MNVPVIADPAGRLIWASPALPGARHDMGAVREHAILDALHTAGVRMIADNGYRGADPMFEIPQQRRRLDRATGRYRPLSDNQRDVNTAHARQRGPGERANAQLKSWKILRKIRCCPRSGRRYRAPSLMASHAREDSIAVVDEQVWARTGGSRPVGNFARPLYDR